MKDEPKILVREENPISLRIAYVSDDGYLAWLSFFPRSLTSFPPVNTTGPSVHAVSRDRRPGESVRTLLYRWPRSLIDYMCLTPLGDNQRFIAQAPFTAHNDHSKLTKANRNMLLRGTMLKLEKSIRPLCAAEHPTIKLTWSDSGQSVAALLNGEPWAFLDGSTGFGYSKAVLDPAVGNPWDEELFRKVLF